MSIFNALIKNPALTLRHRNIFLLSHMRANTSLFGHLLGSHPQIEGYYEMHIGYYSWKSLWRQKFKHFATHSPKTASRFMFDKVLHNGHYVEPSLLLRPDSRSIMMLRAPEQSIKSLMVLFAEQAPRQPEATAEGATRYYIDRLHKLVEIAHVIGPRYFYLDAECLITSTEATLSALSAWLDLESPIPTEYKTFSNTGKGQSGDPSNRLKSGKVSRSGSDYSNVLISQALMTEAQTVYEQSRAALIAGCAESVCIPHAADNEPECISPQRQTS